MNKPKDTEREGKVIDENRLIIIIIIQIIITIYYLSFWIYDISNFDIDSYYIFIGSYIIASLIAQVIFKEI